jgi:protein TonB
MMRLWVQSYSKKASVAPVGAMSAVMHALLIAGWVYVTMPAANVPEDSIANRIIFVPPPDRAPGPRIVHEVVHYIESTRDGPGAGEEGSARAIGNDRPAALSDQAAGKVPPAQDTAIKTAPPTVPPGTEDSVFSILDVDTAVVRSQNSAAPAYPLKLLDAHVMGSVSAQYVVDTTGFADTASFRVLKSTHPEFVAAVREALPYMRFRPAKIGPIKVRQLVEQQFSFKITDSGSVRPAPKKP